MLQRAVSLAPASCLWGALLYDQRCCMGSTRLSGVLQRVSVWQQSCWLGSCWLFLPESLPLTKRMLPVIRHQVGRTESDGNGGYVCASGVVAVASFSAGGVRGGRVPPAVSAQGRAPCVSLGGEHVAAVRVRKNVAGN